MEFRPILSAMWRNRTGSVLVALQIALTLAIVVNSLFLATERVQFIDRPTGIDESNIVTFTSIGFGQSYDHDATIDADLALLRSTPGVIGVTPTSHIPLSGSGNGSGYRANNEEGTPTHSANTFTFDEGALQALGVELAEGRNFTAEEIRRSSVEDANNFPDKVIITRALAEKLYPDQPALGQRMYNNLGESAEIIGIIKLMYGSWVSWNNVTNVTWFPQRNTSPMNRYIVRTEPGLRDQVLTQVEKGLADSNRTRIMRDARTMEELVAQSYMGDRAIAVVLFIAIGLLLLITGLGIVGLASFTVKQRTRQIGTRRAIGARKRDIIRYFLTENWLMTTIGITVGSALTIALNMLLSDLFDLARLNYGYLIAGIFALWLLGLLAVAGPARRASLISPAIATRNV